MKRGYRTARRSMKSKPVKKTPVRGRKAMPKTKKAMPKRTKKSMPKTKKSMPKTKKAKKPKSKKPKSKPKSRSKSVHSSVKYSDVRKCIVLFKKYIYNKSRWNKFFSK